MPTVKVFVKRRLTRKPVSRMPAHLTFEDVTRHAARFAGVLSEIDLAAALYGLASMKEVHQRQSHTHLLHVASSRCSRCCDEVLAIIAWERLKAIEGRWML